MQIKNKRCKFVNEKQLFNVAVLHHLKTKNVITEFENIHLIKIKTMLRNLFLSLALLAFLSSSSVAQKTKSSVKKTLSTPAQLSNAEKMGYARTSKYWGAGSYYCYAPGSLNNKMANNAESAMRDLIGLFEVDFNKEISKQGFVEVPKKEVKKWFNENNSKDKVFYYSADKSYILQPVVQELYKSPVMENGHLAKVSNAMMRYVLIPKEDSLKVMDAVWQYLRDLKEMKVILASFGSTFKNADPKSYPIQRTGSTGWTSMRAGTFVLKMVDGKPKGYWERNEDIVRRTIGKPGFELKILGAELGYGYSLNVTLQKEGYVLAYFLNDIFFKELEPGTTWPMEYPYKLKEYQTAIKMDNESLYKNAPLPPVLEDLNKLLHIK